MSATAKEIQEIIKKNLPQEVGDILKLRLQQADEDASNSVKLREQLDSRNLLIAKLEKQVEEYKTFDNRNTVLEAREKYVDDRERKVELETLRYQLISEQDKTNFAKSIGLGLVRNIEYRNNIFDSESQAGYNGPNNQWIQPGNIVKTYNETKTSI